MRLRTALVVASLAALAFALSQPPLRNPADTNGGSTNQSQSPPSIPATVIGPEPSPEATAKEEKYREREVMAAEDVRDFTRWLTFLTFVQAGLGLLGFGAAIRAANAAKESAETAHSAMWLSQRPIIDIDKLRIALTAGESLTFTFKVCNAGNVVARLIQIDHIVRTDGGKDVSVIGERRTVITGPDKGFDVPISVKLSPEQVLVDFSPTGLEADLQIRVLVKGTLEKRWEVFTRRVHCGPNIPKRTHRPQPDELNNWNANYKNPDD